MVWAWRAGRARRMARWYDHLLTLLPFEPPYFERVGLAASYVGHPVLESGAERGDAARFRAAHGIAADELRDHACCPAAAAARCGGCCRSSARRCTGSNALSGRSGSRCRPSRRSPKRSPPGSRDWPGRPIVLRGQGQRRKIRRLRRQPRRARRLGHGRARTGVGARADGGRLPPQPADRGAARPHREGAAGQSRQSAARPSAGARASAAATARRSSSPPRWPC